MIRCSRQGRTNRAALSGAAGEQAAAARVAREEPGILRAALAMADVLGAHRAAAARGPAAR